MTEAILSDLAHRLSELRQHLEQVRADLNHASGEQPALRCHICGLRRPTGQEGWTLRLCHDDELHTLCPECDRQHVNGSGRSRLPCEVATPVDRREGRAGDEVAATRHLSHERRLVGVGEMLTNDSRVGLSRSIVRLGWDGSRD